MKSVVHPGEMYSVVPDMNISAEERKVGMSLKLHVLIKVDDMNDFSNLEDMANLFDDFDD